MIHTWARDTFGKQSFHCLTLGACAPRYKCYLSIWYAKYQVLEKCRYGLLTAHQIRFLARAILLGAAPDHLFICFAFLALRSVREIYDMHKSPWLCVLKKRETVILAIDYLGKSK